MRRIAIIGAGQSGLQLGLGLLAQGYEVSMVSNRPADAIRAGRVMSSQCMFGAALQTERDLGLNQWDGECPPVEGISLVVPNPDGGGKLIDWAARLDRPAQSVDQRLKVPAWLDLFVQRGGRLTIAEADVAMLDRLAASHDLVLVASGKGDIARLFGHDAANSPFAAPQRALALTYVTGMQPRTPFSAVCFNLIPTVGEYFVFPALTTSGPCEIMVFEGVPGGPMDCWADVTTPAQHLEKSKWILSTFLPWEAARCADIALTDDNGILTGRFAPAVRKPVGRLPSGRPVLGLADAVVLNDPITGQGSNNAAKAAAVYLAAILEHGTLPFDAAWMQATFDRYWDYARWVTRWTNMLLTPPPPHVLKILVGAGQSPAAAHEFVNGFDDPRRFFPWFAEPAEADAFLARMAERSAAMPA